MQDTFQRVGTSESLLATNQVLRNTYTLLAMTLLFAAGMAVVAIRMNMPFFGLWTLLGYFGLLFLTSALRNSAWGIVSVFALTGFMGLTMGPIINAYMTMYSNGSQLVAMAMGGTGLVFLTMSGIALTTKRDLSFMGKFLVTGILVAFLAGLAAYFFKIPALSLAVSAMFVLLCSGLLMYETQQIIRGGERNYIMATVTLFVSIYNIFSGLLHLLGFGLGED